MKIRIPDLSIDMPTNPGIWTGVAINARRLMRGRTARDKVDVKGKPFKPYSKAYKEFRKSKRRGIVPNLVFTGRMLSAIQAIGKKMKGRLLLSGEEGSKAAENEARGRKFFDFTGKERNSILKEVVDWMTKKNRLKR